MRCMERMLKINGERNPLQNGINLKVDLEPIYTLIDDYLAKVKESNNDFVHSEVENFLGESYESQHSYIDGYKAPYYLDIFERFVEANYRVERLMDYSYRRSCEIPPSKRKFKLGVEVERTLVYRGIYFIEDNENPSCRFVVWINPCSEDMSLEIEIFYEKDFDYLNFMSEYEAFFDANHPLSGKIIDQSWTRIDTKKVGWDDVILDENQRKVIDRNIMKFIENLPNYRESGLPTSRGILITGPPGTGKTLCCEVIVNEVGGSAIYVSTDSISQVGDIKRVYSLARKMAPCLVIVEDIDTLGGLDRTTRGGEHPLLGEFLNCLAGMGENDGVITVATTNYANHLDAALADRPGRFDVRLDFDLPNSELREHIMKKYLSDVGSGFKLTKEHIKRTDGLSGAYLKEIVMTSYMIALESDSEKVQVSHFDSALEEVLRIKTKNNPSFKTQKSHSELYG